MTHDEAARNIKIVVASNTEPRGTPLYESFVSAKEPGVERCLICGETLYECIAATARASDRQNP